MVKNTCFLLTVGVGSAFVFVALRFWFCFFFNEVNFHYFHHLWKSFGKMVNGKEGNAAQRCSHGKEEGGAVRRKE